MITVKALSAVALMSAMIFTPAYTVNTAKADTAVKTATVSSTVIATTKEGENETGSYFNIADTMHLVQKHKLVKKTVEYRKVPLSHNFQVYVDELCKKDGVSQQLAYGIMHTESDFDPSKVSPTDDYGLMQINGVNRPMLAQKFGITDWFNPYQNAEAGIYMLGQLTKKYHYENLIAIAYNEGEGGMLSGLKYGVYSTSYSEKVMSYHPKFVRVEE